MKKNKKNLILYLISQSISKIGSSILDFAIIWSIVLHNESSMPFIISIFITYLPKIIIVHILDRINININNRHKLLMNIGDLITALFSFILIFINFENLNIVYFIIFMRSIGAGIMEPYSNSIIVLLFDEEAYYKKVNALNSLLKSITSLLIPVLTALILNYYSLKYIAMIDLITALLSCLLIFKLKLKKIKEEKNKIIKIKLNNLGKKMLIINFVFYFFMTIPGFMTALLVKYYFGNNINFLKYNELFWTIGMILGSYVVMKIDLKNKYYFSYAIILFGATIIILSLSNNILLYLFIILISGISFPLYSTINKLIIQKNMNKLENEIYFLKENEYTNIAIPFSMILCGYILNYIDIKILFLLSGIMIVVLGVISLCKIIKDIEIKL